MIDKPDYEELEKRIKNLDKENKRLKQSAKHLDFISQNIPDIIFKLDPNGIITYINKAVGIYGYLPEDLIGKNIFKIVHPDDIKKAIHRINERRSGERTTKDLHLRLFTKEGEERTFESRVGTDKDPSFYIIAEGIYSSDESSPGIFLGTQGIARDVTERLKIEKTLKISEQKYRSLIENISGVVWETSSEGQTTFISQNIKNIYGYTQDEIYEGGARLWLDRIHPEDLDRVQKALSALLDEGKEYNIEYRVRRKDTKWIWLHDRAKTVIERDGGKYAYGSFSDITNRKEAENALKESEAKFRELIENMPIVCFEYDKNSTILSWNKAAEDIYGYTKKEAVGTSVYDLIVTDHTIEETKKVAKTVFKGKRILESWWQDRNKKGEIGWRYGTTFPLHRSDGSVECGVNLSIDITRRRKTEEALKKSEQGLNQAQEVAHIGSWNLNMPTNELSWSDEAYRIFGFPPNETELTYGKFLGFIHPEDRENVDKKWNSALNKEEYYNIEHRIIVSDEVKWVNERAIIEFNEKGEPVSATGTVHDITERKETEEALRNSEKKYRMVIENANDGIFLMKNDKIVYCNPSMVKMFGCSSSKQIIGKGPMDFAPPRQPDGQSSEEKVFDKTNSVLKGTPQYFEYLHKKLDGTPFDVEVSLKAMKLRDEINLIAIVRDVTDRKKTEQEKIQLQQKLIQAQKMEAIGTLTGGIAHDFNNILGAILGNLDLIKMYNEPISTDVKHHIEEGITAARRGANLVKQLLTFSRQRKEEKKEFYVQPIIKEALKFLRASIPSTIKIKDDIYQYKSMISGDPTSINQIVMNLCTNAYHAMEKNGGTLELLLDKITLSKEDLVFFPELIKGDYVHLSVSDTGHGIKKKDLDKIFDPFFTTKEEGKGTGLGLSTVYGIIQGYGGTIKVYSELGKGTKFDIYIPEYKEEIKAQEETVKETITRGKGNILLVDDDKAIRDTVEMSLILMGYNVMAFEDSQKALEVFKSKPDNFDLVMTDLTMPNLTGDQLADKIHEIKSDIPIILSSGRDMREEKPDIIYLPKPYDLVTVSKIISENIGIYKNQ